MASYSYTLIYSRGENRHAQASGFSSLAQMTSCLVQRTRENERVERAVVIVTNSDGVTTVSNLAREYLLAL